MAKIKCPHCKNLIDHIHYVKDEGYEIWDYPIVANGKKKELDYDNGDVIKSEFFNCCYECPECEKTLEMGEIKIDF